MNSVIDEILRDHSYERDFGQTKQVSKMMKRGIFLRIVDNLLDMKPTTAVEFDPLGRLDHVHAVVDRLGLNVVIRVDLHEPALAFVQMQATYGKMGEIVEILETVRVLVGEYERVACQIEYEPIEADVVVGERVVEVEAVDVDVLEVDFVVAEDAARVHSVVVVVERRIVVDETLGLQVLVGLEELLLVEMLLLLRRIVATTTSRIAINST